MHTAEFAGIWRHETLLAPTVRARALAASWSLGEGDTPLQPRPDLAAELDVAELLLKREDLNPGGSHKDRGLLYQVAHHHADAAQTFVLSSSGNAAVSAAAACAATGDRLIAFIAPGTAAHKRARLGRSDAVLIETLKPINFARYAARVFGLHNLRGTQDPVATVGYRSLAAELLPAAPHAVFTFSSSGISLEGMGDGFDALGAAPALWSVQSGACVGIARVLHPGVAADPTSPAGPLGIRNPPHAQAIARRLTASGGDALAVDGDAVRRWQGRLDELGVQTSAEGAAVLAGVQIAAADGALASSRVVAVCTGRRGTTEAAEDAAEPLRTSSYLELRELLCGLGLEPL